MKFTKSNLKDLRLKDLNNYIGEKKELNIAEYSSIGVRNKGVNLKDYSQKKEIKNFGINKFTFKPRKNSQAELERKREKMLSMGDVVKSSKYGVGKIINKSKQAKLLKKITVSFINGGVIDVFPETLTIIKKRKLRK